MIETDKEKRCFAEIHSYQDYVPSVVKKQSHYRTGQTKRMRLPDFNTIGT
jgi:hypothetical protein